MKKKSYIFPVIIILIISLFSNVYSDNIITKEALIKKIKNFFKKYKTIKGNFILIRNGRVERGEFFYKSPNRFKMKFAFYSHDPNAVGKTIVSNGKNIWVYLNSLNVVVDQRIQGATQNIAYSGAGFGIRRLIGKFKVQFLNNDNKLKRVPGLKEPVRILQLNRSRSFTGFKEILLFVRKDGFIAKSRAITNTNRAIELIRTNIKLNVDISDKEFIFRIPKNAQIIKNPLVPIIR